MLVVAFVLWYELESHALGPAGPQVVVAVHQGESSSAIVDALSQQHVIGSSLAFQISEVLHGMPTVLPGSYALHQNLAFSEVRVILAAGPNIYPVDVRPGFTLSEVAQEVDSLPGHAGGGFEKTAASGAVHSVFSPPGSDNLEGMLGTGNYLVLPGESDTTILTDMVQRFDHDAEGGRSQHGLGGGVGYDALPGHHGGLDRGEGGLRPGQHARHVAGHLQPAGPGHPDSRWTPRCSTRWVRTEGR